MGTAPGDASKSWDAFYAHWVKPVVHFGTPTLIVFAVLMTLAVFTTPLLVGVGTPGIRSSGKGPGRALGGAYWLGVGCLLFSAIEATIVFPLSLNVPAQPERWAAGVSTSLISAALIVVVMLLKVVGQDRPPVRGLFYFLYGATIILIIGIALGIGLHWSTAWLAGDSAVLVCALVLAALGIALVAWARGIGIGLVIQGHDKTGAGDAGLGAFVRVRLYLLGSQEPKGILFTQQTDISTLPSKGSVVTQQKDASTLASGALGLIPAGILAKLAALFVSLFTPPTPWRVDVTEQNDGSIAVSVRRNGRVAEAAVIRASTLELPSKQVEGANGGSDAGGSTPAVRAGPPGSGPSGSGADGDWTTELRTAAAAFVLVTLSRCYYHLRAGLCGATDWRSVALQVIASDPASRLSAKDRHAALVQAVADDRENKAAELALLSDSYRTATSPDDLAYFATKLERLLDRLPEHDEGTLPLRLRSRFNMILAYVNYAASLTGKQPDEAALRRAACAALMKAKTQVVYLLDFWSRQEMQYKYTALWQSMYASVYFAAESISAELHRTCDDDEAARIPNAKEAHYLLHAVNWPPLARYEYACCLTRGRRKLGAAKAAEYAEALNELEMAVADPVMLRWARRDPSLAELHDVDQVRQACADAQETLEVARTAFKIVARFKDLVGDPVPADFLSLPPFAAYRDALLLRGIHDAAELRQTPTRRLRSELSITLGEVALWLRVTDLYEMVGACRSSGDGATGAVFLLLRANLDSVSALCDALKRPGNLREELLSLARDWAVVVPGEQEIGTWGTFLGVPQH
jgi:hypothetical protein